MDDPSPQAYAHSPEPPPRPKPWVTWSIVASTVAVFLLQLEYERTEGADVVGYTLGFSSQALNDGRVWTLITYAWVHSTDLFGIFFAHVAANMITLYSFGRAVETFLGHWRYLGLYIGGAVASALTWYVCNLGGDPTVPIIGASGAVFAVLAAIGTIAPRTRITVLLFFVVPLNITLGNLALLICGAEAVQMIFGWMPEIAHSAHLGGAAFGALYVLVLRFLNRRTYFPV
jgi:membrane associated rhomboid family serine protease